MKKEYQIIRDLLSKYLEGKSSLEDEEILFDFFDSDNIPEEFQIFQSEFIHYKDFQRKEPEQIYFSEIIGKKVLSEGIISSNLVKVAAMLILMIGAFYLGRRTIQKDSIQPSELAEIKNELSEIKTYMAGRLITQKSSHDKIQGLLLVSEADITSNEIVSDILNIYESDSNPIVRSMALDFLKNHVKNEEVRNSMIGILSKEDLIQLQLETIMIIKKLNDIELKSRLNSLIENNLLQEKLKVEMEKII